MDLCEQDIQQYRHPWESARAKTILTVLKQYLSPNNTRILDMGCGDAYFANRLLQTFPHKSMAAIDLNFTEDHLAYLQKTYPNIHFGTHLQDHETFDLILLMDVIEHIENDIHFLSQLIQKHLNPEGQVLITVPAFQSLFSGHDVFLKHYRRYSRKQLLNTIDQCGLTPQHSGYIFSFLLFPRIINLIKEKILPTIKNNQQGISNWTHGACISNTLSSILYITNLWGLYLSKINIQLPGLTTWTICHKKPLK